MWRNWYADWHLPKRAVKFISLDNKKEELHEEDNERVFRNNRELVSVIRMHQLFSFSVLCFNLFLKHLARYRRNQLEIFRMTTPYKFKDARDFRLGLKILLFKFTATFYV